MSVRGRQNLSRGAGTSHAQGPGGSTRTLAKGIPVSEDGVPLQHVLIDFIQLFGYYPFAFNYLNRFSGGFPWAK